MIEVVSKLLFFSFNSLNIYIYISLIKPRTFYKCLKMKPEREHFLPTVKSIYGTNEKSLCVRGFYRENCKNYEHEQ